MLTQAQEEWCQALESGKYSQTRNGVLKDRDGFCCLGLACELDHMKVFKNRANSGKLDHMSALDDSPRATKVQHKLGLRTGIGNFKKLVHVAQDGKIYKQVKDIPSAIRYKPYKGVQCLAGLNDEGVSFADIAAFIRTEPEGLFV